MFTKEYYTILSRSQDFHSKSVNWSGSGSWQYLNIITEQVNKNNCQTMLDYGCGKGTQYPLFAKKIGIKDYTLYDPAWPDFETLPNNHWDITLCLDVLPFIPETDIDRVLDLLASITNKICIVGLQSTTPAKSKKPFACVKDYNWWKEKLARDKFLLVWHEPQEPFIPSLVSA